MTFKDPIQFKPFCHSMVHGAIPCFRQVVLVKREPTWQHWCFLAISLAGLCASELPEVA